MQKRKIGALGLIATLAAIASLLTLLLATRPPPEVRLREERPAQVSAHIVGLHDIAPIQTLSGRLQPAHRATLHMEVGGAVVERPVEPGTRVEAGALLLRLDQGDLGDLLTEAEARLTQEELAQARDRTLLALATEQRALQEREAARLEKLGQQSLASRTNLDEARQRLSQLRGEEARLTYAVESGAARLALEHANRDRAARNLARTRLNAPFTATVNRVEVEVGDYANALQAVVELIDTTRLDLYLEVDGEGIAALIPGQGVEVEVGEQTLSGTITALQGAPQASTDTHPLRIRIPGDGLRSGQLATVRLPQPRLEGVVAVPVTAVLRDEGVSRVFVIKAGRLAAREIEPGVRHGDLLTVRRGLSAGEAIVARDVAALSDGLAVQESEK